MSPGHLLWVLFGPGTWGAGGTMVAWVICGGLGFWWAHRRAEARAVRVMAQAARHHFERLDQAAKHHDEVTRQLTLHCADIKEHVTAQAAGPGPGDRT